MMLRMALFHFFWLISGFWMYLGSKFQIFYIPVILYPLDPAFLLVLSDAALPVTCMCSSFIDLFGVGGRVCLSSLRAFAHAEVSSLHVSFFHLDNTNATFRYNCKCQLLILDTPTKLEPPVYMPLYFCSLFSFYDTDHNCKWCWLVCLLVQYSSPTLDWEWLEDSGCICGDCSCFWHIAAL